MKKYVIYCLSLFLFGASTAFAQDDESDAQVVRKVTTSLKKQYPTRVVKGRVINGASKSPVSGAMVRVGEIDGYSALTHSDGTFEIKVPLFATSLEVSAPDMNMSKMGLVKDEQQKDVYLYPATFVPEYRNGTNVTAENMTTDFRFSDATSIEDEIQKRLGAEVHTTMRNGTSGVGGVMFMNGLNSLNINSQPLIVIDDVIFDQQYGRSVLHQGFYNDILANISPADIETVTVLRNGTALYGAKGANGVILIKTRRNHSMATRITASVSAGVTLEPKFIDVMNATQYKNYASDLLKSVRTNIRDFKFLNEDPNYYYYPQYHNNTNWKDQIYRTAITQNYNINVEGGDDVADYNLSLGYMDKQSVLKYNKHTRLNIRFNTDIRLLEQFHIRFDASFANQTRNIRNDGAPMDYVEGTPTSPSFLAYAKSPMLSPYAYANRILSDSYLDITDESYLDEALAEYANYNYKLANPIALNEYSDAENKNRFENSMVNLSVTPKYQFNRHLFVSEHFSYNLVNTNEKFYIPINGVPSYFVSSVNAYRENEVRSLAGKQNSVMSDTRVDWNNRYGAHAIHAFGGVRINWESYTLNTQLGYNTGSDKTPFISSQLLNATTTGVNDNWNSIAWYAQAEYNFLQRYYLQANLTAEASSRFGKDADHSLKAFDAAWGIFPGVQAAWVVSNEPWFAKVKGINYLRLNVGYDISGNDDIDYYAARSYFRAQKFLDYISGLSFDNIGNTNIQWETTKRFNAGFETNVFNNRLNIKFNYFNSKVDNLLTYQALGYLSGLERTWSNGGSMKNEGFDVSAVAKVVSTKNFQWELGASMGHYENKITKLVDGQNSFDTSIYGATVRTEIGHPANMFYGYKVVKDASSPEGVFKTSEDANKKLFVLGANGIDKLYFGAGDMHFEDKNNDGQITEADRSFIGNPNPDIYGNIFTSLMYKRLKLDINFNYCLGNDVYNYMRSQLEGGSRFMNQTTAITRSWQTEGQVTDIPKVTFQDPLGNSRFSDRWIEDGSYLRLKSVTLSYSLPVHSTFLQGFQFWVQGNNLLTFSKYLGSDPEFSMTSSVLGQGIDLGQLPQSRSIVAGIKINL
ncbi:MAG: SusC/RagA family TonB-linked outer membrane protein [Prevotella sp.]|nr:SusC/RagA family TonB-linked outer membrane protein [Prevotella sp.]